MADFFTKEVSKAYDERNSKLSPITDNIHFLIRLILKDLPIHARILCVGVGTGAELLSLSKEYPEWSYVGIDPSAAMLEVCQERLQNAGIMERCKLIQGYVQDLPDEEGCFDAVLSVLVAHFVKREDRLSFYQNMLRRLKTGGYFISSEISFDLNSIAFPSMLKNWERVQTLMGATPASLEALPNLLRETLSILSPTETESLLQASGMSVPIRFFQSFMVTGWYGKHEDKTHPGAKANYPLGESGEKRDPPDGKSL